MGQPGWSSPVARAMREEPGEVKHLSNPRKRNRRDSLSSGERKGKSLNRIRVKTAVVAGMGLWEFRRMVRRLSVESESVCIVEVYWESMPQRVRAP